MPWASGALSGAILEEKDMKKVMKWVAILLLTPILLFLLLTVLLYTPPVQNWAVKKAAAYASEQTGMDITVGHVALRFPLDLTLDDVKVIRDNDSIAGLRDTIADVGKLYVDVQWKPLLDKRVEIDALGAERLRLNTDGLIPDLRVKGNVEHLDLECHGADLKEAVADITRARLDSACLDICLADTMPPDTTESENNWRIRLAEMQVARTAVTLHTPGDTLQVSTYFADATVSGGDIDLGKGVYNVQHVECGGARLKYDNRFEKPTDGLDTNHLDLSDISFSIDSIRFASPHIALALRDCSFREKSGIHVEKLTADVELDSTTVRLPHAYLRTPDSQVTASVDMDLNTFDDKRPGQMRADVDGYFGKQDLMRFMGDMPADFRKKWPNHPLTVRGRARGNMKRLDVQGMQISLPTALQMSGDGYIANLNDPDRLQADLAIKGRTTDLDFLTSLADKSVTDKLKVPQGIDIDGRFKANGHLYGADFTASEGGGKLKANVAFDADRTKYSATIDADRFPLQHFVTGMGLSPLTAHIEADGQGTDLFSPATTLRAKARIGKFHYEGYDLDGMAAEATLARGKLRADIDSHNPLLNGKISLDALMNTKRLQGTFAFDLAHADFHSLRLTDMPVALAGCAHLDIDTDMDENIKVVGSMSDLTINYKNTIFRPDDLVLDILTRRDTTYAKIDSGDFHLDMNGGAGYKKMLKQAERFGEELSEQLRDKHFDQVTLREKLPDANIYLTSGKDNFFIGLLQEEGYSVDRLFVDMKSSHTDGLNGDILVDGLQADSILLDSIRFTILTDSAGFKYKGMVRNGPDHPRQPFRATFDGSVLEQGATINAQLYDRDDRLGLDVGAMATLEDEGIMAHLTKTDPVIGYIPFTANEDNYLFLGADKRLSANLKLKSDNGMHMQLYTNDDNTDALQDLTLSLGKIDLHQVLSILPYMPDVKGIADGDFHIVQTEKDLSVSSSLNVAGLQYEGTKMGNIGSEFVYMPNEDGSHHVDAVLFAEGEEVGTLIGTYKPEGEGYIDARMSMKGLPLELVNGFIPDQLFGFKGTAEGDLAVKGTLSKPDVNGELYLENTRIISIPYGVEMRVADDPIRIVGSNILFENFEVLDRNNTPLNISGYYDFSDFDNMSIDLRMRTRNFLLVDAKENAKSEAFGKAFVNFFGTVKGPVDQVAMRGRLSVLGATDMTYVLRDSPLTADTRMDELVTFVNFADSTEQVVTRPPLTGFNMDLTLSVDEGAHIKCDLNADHSNYIDLVGGGDLRMRYNVIDNLMLTGRYVLNNGEMKYSLPIIPLKTFTIQEGSYIEFRGDPMNPMLHITATESRKAAVEDEGGGTRSVDFVCGVVITQTLNDMGLEFIISAPDDVAIGSELASMTIEERGKVAVTMLTTGMYLADGNTSGFTMNGALSAFLQNEINNITGNALRTLDLSIGIDNSTDASGAMHTDYSFKFSKRLWNNRLRIVIGGMVSSGSSTEAHNNSFFTDVAFEYRLSPTSNKYLKLFYNRDSYDWIEGQVGEYGGGFLWRRKLQHFKDIFRWKTDTPTRSTSTQRTSTFDRPMPSRTAETTDTTAAKQALKDTLSTPSTSTQHENGH